MEHIFGIFLPFGTKFHRQAGMLSFPYYCLADWPGAEQRKTKSSCKALEVPSPHPGSCYSVPKSRYGCKGTKISGRPIVLIYLSFPCADWLGAERRYTITFLAQIQFRPDISTAVSDSKKSEVFKSQEFHDNHKYITLKC